VQPETAPSVDHSKKTHKDDIEESETDYDDFSEEESDDVMEPDDKSESRVSDLVEACSQYHDHLLKHAFKDSLTKSQHKGINKKLSEIAVLIDIFNNPKLSASEKITVAKDQYNKSSKDILEKDRSSAAKQFVKRILILLFGNKVRHKFEREGQRVSARMHSIFTDGNPDRPGDMPDTSGIDHSTTGKKRK
jgi:hypothetical protein